MIALENVTLDRRLPSEASLDLKGTIFSMVRGRYRSPLKHRVLDSISFRAEHGEKIGLIGPNGAGKSTLLKVIAGVLKPTSGELRVDGRLAPLIELGAGFDPELSVADNIVLYGVLLGLSRQVMHTKIEGILQFSELEGYREAPVRILSSGMQARLGFAVATDVEAEVLLIDEVLSIGDEQFRTKSKRRLNDLWTHDRTAIVVTHDLPFVREACNRALWVDNGTLRFDGNANEAVDAYLRAVDRSAVEALERARRLG